jgi:hypothetical protein
VRVGRQEPRLRSVPAYTSTLGPEAVDLAAAAGQILDPWQVTSVCDILGCNDRGLWAALETDVIAQRQQGKGGIIETIEMGGLFLFGERLILHSAHEYKTAQEGFLRIRALIEGSDDLTRHVKAIREANGEQQVIMMRGCCPVHPRSESEHRLRFVARSKGSGRGFTGQRNILDEAQELVRKELAALMPTMSAQPNPQLNRFATVPDPQTMPPEAEAVLPAAHRRALAAVQSGAAGRHCYLDWSVRAEELPAGDPMTDRAVAREYIELAYECNPALGIRISEDYVVAELAALGVAKFSVERLGLWPAESGAQWQVITEPQWTSTLDPASAAQDPVSLAVYTAPDRRTTCIGAAGQRTDGDLSFGVYAHASGTEWVPGTVVTAVRDLKPCRLVIDKAGAGANLVVEVAAALKEAKLTIEVTTMTTAEVGQAYGMVYDALTRTGDVPAWRLWHRGDKRMTGAVAGAVTRSLGREGTTWDTLATSADLSPIIAGTNAVWGFVTRPATFSPMFARA